MNNLNLTKVTVVDYNKKPIENATVTLTVSGKKTALKFDKFLGVYSLGKFIPGRYVLTVELTGFESQSREINLPKTGIDETFVLGKAGMPFYYRGKVKVPFNYHTDNFGLALGSADDKKQVELVTTVANRLKLTLEKTNENYRKNGLFIFKYPVGIKEDEKQRLAESLKTEVKALTAGAILQRDVKNASILTDEIIVRFKGSVEEKQVLAIVKKLGLVILRTVPYAGNGYHFRVVKGGLYKALDVCNQLVGMGIVEYAEPNLFQTFEDDAIVPTNYLFPEQWDHPIINTPDAWQVLNDSLGVAQRFGSPNVVVAVVDSGVNVAHPHFTSTVSNGQPKIINTFDFSNMVANNNTLGGSHGTNCASASVGFTSATSVPAGVPDGTIGVAGNCRLMGIRRGGTEADYADMYVWIGGFNPNSAKPGFPAPLGVGADIITSSFGAGFTAPIAGVMQDAFDMLITYGRSGKGIIMTFSVGNYATNSNFHLTRPWAAYPKTFACGASTLGNNGATEIISAYSGSGTLLDFCAPSHDAYVNGLPLHNPPTNYGAWTGTVLNGVSEDDGKAPRNRERQTTMSVAANLGATSITVASTAGMANGQAIIIRNPSPNVSQSEAKRITNIVGNVITFTPALFANKAIGTIVNYGNRDYNNAFGGTSYSTPVIAGVSALLLSINNRLTWMEVREILRGTAAKIDPNNVNAVGRWVDTQNRISTDPAYTGPFFSQFYGYGRINAAAAVVGARDYAHNRDIYVRDNMSDTGAGTSASPFWQGVDIWVRNVNDGIAPANYATNANTVHQSPIAGQSNWLNVRYRNRGAANSFPFYVRAYIAHYPGAEFVYPTNFIPSVRPNGVMPNPLTPGTYLIGEQLVNPVVAGADGFVTMEWTQDLIPPQTVSVGGVNVNWHPCILVEVTPHDGFIPTGNHVWDNNNLAQKNLTIIYPDASSDNASLVVLGNKINGKIKTHKIVIYPEPKIDIPYFITFTDARINELLVTQIYQKISGATVGSLNKAKGIWVKNPGKISFDIPNYGLTAIIVGIGKQKTFTKSFELHVVQYSGRLVSGSCGVEFRTKK
jgi:hypothetical protein